MSKIHFIEELTALQHKFKIFKKVVELGSFTKAGEDLGMTQSAVSHAIHALEIELGFVLINRSRGQISLTREGQMLIDYVSALIAAEDRLLNQINSIKQIETGTIRIGSFTSASSRLLPDILHSFDKAFPDIQVEVIEDGYDSLKKSLEDGIVDVAFLEDQYLESHYYALPYFRDEIIAIVPSQYELSQQEDFDLLELDKYPFIMPDNDSDTYLHRLFERYHVKPDIKYKILLMSTVFSMVEKGLGMSIVPESTLNKTLYDFDIFTLSQGVRRQINIVSLKTSMTSPIINAFFNIAHSIHHMHHAQIVKTEGR